MRGGQGVESPKLVSMASSGTSRSARAHSSPNVCAGPFGAVYDFYIERDWLMRLIGRVVWGIDASLLYASMDAISRAGFFARRSGVVCAGAPPWQSIAIASRRPLRFAEQSWNR